MPKRKAVSRSKAKKRAPQRKRSKGKKVSSQQTLEKLLSQIVPDYTQRLYLAETKAAQLEEAHTLLKNRLVKLLSVDQMEAARICGCPPEIYAIECIDLWKEKIFPSFARDIRSFPELKSGAV